jgi:hypothetical protein
LDQETLNKVAQMQYEVRRVRFEPPEGIEELSFHPMGIPGYRNFTFGPPKRRMLVMSPFLSDNFVKNLVRQRKGCVLISRQVSLEMINTETLQQYGTVFTLSRDVETEESDEEVLSGLHAKLFVMDDGWKANVWTGSANATDAAFNTNVEFLVCLRGRLGDLGIGKLLVQEGHHASFADLLQEYRGKEETVVTDATQKELEKRLRTVRLALLAAKLFAEITPVENTREFQLELKTVPGNERIVIGDVKIRCWPITLPSHRAVPIDMCQGIGVNFGKVSLDALTAFFAFELVCAGNGQTCTERFVTKVPLVGLPEGRMQKLLGSLLENKSQVLRLLLLLLADSSMPMDKLTTFHGFSGIAGTSSDSESGGIPLLESLMKALARSSEKLDRISRLVEDLEKTDESVNLLPDGFMPVWKSIWQIRKEMVS